MHQQVLLNTILELMYKSFILKILSSGYGINNRALQKYCLETAELFAE